VFGEIVNKRTITAAVIAVLAVMAYNRLIAPRLGTPTA
jgi:hypothetical protein